MLAKLDIESWSRLSLIEIETGLSAIVKNSSDVQLLLDAHVGLLVQNRVLDFVTGDWTDIKNENGPRTGQIEEDNVSGRLRIGWGYPNSTPCTSPGAVFVIPSPPIRRQAVP